MSSGFIGRMSGYVGGRFLINVNAKSLEKTEETFTINLYDITETTANLGIKWENTAVRVPIEFFTKEAMEETMIDVFAKNALEYAIAASYYLERGIELEKAKELQELSISLREQPSAWAYNSYGNILLQLGEKEKALEAIQYSLELAAATKNEYLIKENEKLLKKLKE